MERLWAPWRLEYVEKATSAENNVCIFCSAPETIQHPDSLTLYAGPLTVVLLNKFPYNNAHLLVAPRRHEASTETLKSEELADMMRIVNSSLSFVREAYSPDGFNVGFNLGRAGGAGIPDHVHCHIVPRWNGDTNFMPVLADVKVLPEHLLSSKKKLKPFFDKI